MTADVKENSHMPHLLDIIKKEHIKRAAIHINKHGVDRNNEWNYYFVEVDNKFYPFKYIVSQAYKLATGNNIRSTFQSNQFNRNKIRDLGYNISYVKDGINYFEINENKLEIENRIARVTWNEYGWIAPSGPDGKSKTQSYEKNNGFGHEEWNFNPDHQIGDYKYGFLEPVNKFFETYTGRFYNISLYSRNNKDGKDYWITTLENVEIISKEEADWVVQEYIKRGWYKSMKSDLKNIGLNKTKLDDWPHDVNTLFNIKFKASQLFQLNDLIPVENKNDIRSHRYNLMKISSNLVQRYKEKAKAHGSFETSGTTNPSNSLSKYKRKYQTQEKEIEIKHGLIQQEFMIFLQNKYGVNNVKCECKGYGMSRIDIVRKTSEGEQIYYEVKSYTSLLTSLRQAIGQLLEYCLYPDVEKAKEIVLVSNIDPSQDKELQIYINRLKNYLKIPFSYICFDPDTKKIIYTNGQEGK